MERPWIRVFPPEPPVDEEFTENTGPKEIPRGTSSPISYFLLLFSTNLIREIVRQTNRCTNNDPLLVHNLCSSFFKTIKVMRSEEKMACCVSDLISNIFFSNNLVPT